VRTCGRCVLYRRSTRRGYNRRKSSVVGQFDLCHSPASSELEECDEGVASTQPRGGGALAAVEIKFKLTHYQILCRLAFLIAVISPAGMVTYVFLLAFGIGVVDGLRSLTAPAVVAWAAHLGWLDLHNSPLAFMGSTIAVAIFSALALGELVADKLPWMSKRTAPAPLLARSVMGGLCGACLLAAAGRSLLVGALLGGAGGVVGAFFGYYVRRDLVTKLHIEDFIVAISEDLLAISVALFIASR